jgi:hypothetical protein
MNSFPTIIGSAEEIDRISKVIYRDALKGFMTALDDDRTNTIIDYSYAPKTTYSENGTKTENMVTTLTFFDGSKTTVTCPTETANQYTGFYIAVAKHFMGNDNTVNDEAEYWIEKRPVIDAKNKERKEKALAEENARQERIAKKRRKNDIRRAARQRKFDYEAKQYANEKYGVPMDFEK